ncbi:hypothetical protein BKA70DRAFT_1170590 [Coprinopsis sp. MPI-PUGE-AT-0042]|nr:hypothetical protein BKA70DRAFT_1170590 [Coprinopsis sp. MPI-PUGE-AT-0042]
MLMALASGHVEIFRLLLDFRFLEEVESETTALSDVAVVGLDSLQVPVGDEVQDESESSDSDCYQDAEEWLEGVEVQYV